MEDAPAPDGLRPALRQTEAEITQRLEEACEAESRDISEESTAELVRLDDSLRAASRATERAIAIRRKLKQPEREPETSSAPGSASPAAETSTAVREFRDAAGHAWRAWAVTPGRVRAVRDPQRSFGELSEGWLAFESLETGARKRLPHYPPDWLQLEDEALRRLLESALEGRRREGE